MPKEFGQLLFYWIFKNFIYQKESQNKYIQYGIHNRGKCDRPLRCKSTHIIFAHNVPNKYKRWVWRILFPTWFSFISSDHHSVWLRCDLYGAQSYKVDKIFSIVCFSWVKDSLDFISVVDEWNCQPCVCLRGC